MNNYYVPWYTSLINILFGRESLYFNRESADICPIVLFKIRARRQLSVYNMKPVDLSVGPNLTLAIFRSHFPQ